MDEAEDNSATRPEDEFCAELSRALAEGDFLRLSLGKYRGADPEMRRAVMRPVVIGDEQRVQLVLSRRADDATRNLPLSEAVAELRRLLGEGFKSAHLFTTTCDLQLEFNRRGRARLNRSRPTRNPADDRAHDRPKRRAVDPASPWLRELGVTDERGRVRASMQDKWKQINRFVEILDASIKGTALEGKEGLRVVDFGCGKGYLTFAAHSHLRAAATLGVELRPALVEQGNTAARRCGCDGLRFQAGDIADCDPGEIDVLVALHACDTATDLALHQGIRKGAGLILCAPCCHKEIRPQMRIPEPLAPMLRHGVHLGAEAEMVTDTLRALLLETAGYSVKVFEFISLEHTSRNRMISAVKNGSAARSEAAREEFRRLKAFYGIGEQQLETLLG